MAQPNPLEFQPWYHRAACLEVDPDVFFPEKGKKGATVAAAKRICRACPVLADCRTWVLANEERYGVWAAMTERERRLRRPRQPKQHANAAKTHCKHGHPFNEENTKIDNAGKRVCLACRRERVQQRPKAS